MVILYLINEVYMGHAFLKETVTEETRRHTAQIIDWFESDDPNVKFPKEMKKKIKSKEEVINECEALLMEKTIPNMSIFFKKMLNEKVDVLLSTGKTMDDIQVILTEIIVTEVTDDTLTAAIAGSIGTKV